MAWYMSAWFQIYLYSIKIKNTFIVTVGDGFRLLCTYTQLSKGLFMVFSLIFIKNVQPEPPLSDFNNLKDITFNRHGIRFIMVVRNPCLDTTKSFSLNLMIHIYYITILLYSGERAPCCCSRVINLKTHILPIIFYEEAVMWWL